jgi:hypothetical protein
MAGYVACCMVCCMLHAAWYVAYRKWCARQKLWNALHAALNIYLWASATAHLAAHAAVHSCATSEQYAEGHSRTIVVPTISPASTFASMRWQVTPVTLQRPAQRTVYSTQTSPMQNGGNVSTTYDVSIGTDAPRQLQPTGCGAFRSLCPRAPSQCASICADQVFSSQHVACTAAAAMSGRTHRRL